MAVPILGLAPTGVDLGAAGTRAPIIEKHQCRPIHPLLTPFYPNILVCPPNIFEKSTLVLAPAYVIDVYMYMSAGVEGVGMCLDLGGSIDRGRNFYAFL